MKMPHALANAEEASLPTLVLEGKQALRIRRTQAKGGSNSMAVADDAEGVVVDVDVEGVSFLVVLLLVGVEVDAAAGVLLLLAGVSLEGVAADVVVASAMMRVVWISQRV